jgi:hypothetical protein
MKGNILCTRMDQGNLANMGLADGRFDGECAYNIFISGIRQTVSYYRIS